MIKLERNFTPICLNPTDVQRLTDEYKTTGNAVWNIEALKQALLQTSYGKCAYCECDLTEESKYMEVEHFRDKDSYPDYVASWSNLLPSCKRCNGAKGSHDTVVEPIVNPYETDPINHFEFRLYRFRAKSPLAASTIGTLDLNNPTRVVPVRFEVGESIHEALQTASGILETFKNNSATRTKNRLISTIRGILAECQPASSYAATAASVVHSDKTYTEIIGEMKRLAVWNDELDALHESSLTIAFEMT